MTGEVRLSAQVANSRETHPCIADFATYGTEISRPGVPNSCGIATVKPASTTRWANATTFGVMPGISLITTTPGPLPARYTVRVVPPYVNVSSVKAARASAIAADYFSALGAARRAAWPRLGRRGIPAPLSSAQNRASSSRSRPRPMPPRSSA